MKEHSYKTFEFFYDDTFIDYPISANLDLQLFTYDIVANSGFVRATFTRENVDDLRNMHGIDAEAELTAILSEEINRAIIDELFEIRRNV